MRIGVDLGGTKIEAIIMSDDGKTLLKKRIKSPRDSYQYTLDAIYDLVTQLETEAGVAGKQLPVGVAMPGAISKQTGMVKNANSTWLIGHPMQQDLRRLFARSVLLENDANCFALSEAVDGAAKGAGSVFGVIIGTGTGAGIVINGKLHSGVNAIGGEWGHNPLPWPKNNELPGRDCYCGLTGCVETWLSGPGFAQDYQHRGGRLLSAEQIVHGAESGELLANACLTDYEHRLARSLAVVINILDPEVIVLGGGMSNIERLYDNVPRYWSEYVFSDHIETRLVAAKYGDSSGVRGAARLEIK